MNETTMYFMNGTDFEVLKSLSNIEKEFNELLGILLSILCFCILLTFQSFLCRIKKANCSEEINMKDTSNEMKSFPSFTDATNVRNV